VGRPVCFRQTVSFFGSPAIRLPVSAGYTDWFNGLFDRNLDLLQSPVGRTGSFASPGYPGFAFLREQGFLSLFLRKLSSSKQNGSIGKFIQCRVLVFIFISPGEGKEKTPGTYFLFIVRFGLRFMAVGQKRRLNPRAHSQLIQNTNHVRVHRRQRYEKPAADLPIAQP
jgi:hypothetical protein